MPIDLSTASDAELAEAAQRVAAAMAVKEPVARTPTKPTDGPAKPTDGPAKPSMAQRARNAIAAVAKPTTAEVKPAKPPSPFLGPRIAQELAILRAGLPALEADEGQAALAVLDDMGDQDVLNGVRAKISAAHDRIRTLEAAQRAAVIEDQRKRRALVAETNQTYIRALGAHLAARDKAAAELRQGLEAAAVAWRVLITRSEKALAVNLGRPCDVPAGHLCGQNELERLIAAELYRVTAGLKGGLPGSSFPGADCPDHRVAGKPEAIKPIDEAIREASAYVMGVMRGKIPEAK